MGQYYTPVLFTKTGGRVIASFKSYDYDHNGAKLMEHSYRHNDLVEGVVARMLTEEAPTTVVWLGDYATLEDDVLPLRDCFAFKYEHNKCSGKRDVVKIFERAERTESKPTHKILPNDADVTTNLPLADDVVFYNHTTKQKLSLHEYYKNVIAHRARTGFDSGYPIGCFIIHPLPLLTCLGNGKGGGDYSGLNMEWVGSWTMCAIEAVPEALQDSRIQQKEDWKDISDIIFEEN